MDAGGRDPVEPKKPVRQAKKTPRTRGLAAERDGEPEAMPSRMVRRVSDDEGDGYVDQDSEWADARFDGQEKHPAAEVFHDFTGDKGMSGKTDVNEAQFALLWNFRNMEKDFEERGMGDMAAMMREGSEWFETYRLSVGRKSRHESVELLRGKLDVTTKSDDAGSPLRFG